MGFSLFAVYVSLTLVDGCKDFRIPRTFQEGESVEPREGCWGCLGYRRRFRYFWFAGFWLEVGAYKKFRISWRFQIRVDAEIWCYVVRYFWV